MSRLPYALVLGAAVLASGAGCRSSCGSSSNAGSRGLFSSNAQPNNVPCTLTGGSARPTEGCFDAITGRPVPCPPAGAAVEIPGGTYQPPAAGDTRPDVLPFPSPSDMIPKQSVPFAPPMPAPGVGFRP